MVTPSLPGIITYLSLIIMTPFPSVALKMYLLKTTFALHSTANGSDRQYDGEGDLDITEIDITESAITNFQEIDITESDITEKGNCYNGI